MVSSETFSMCYIARLEMNSLMFLCYLFCCILVAFSHLFKPRSSMYFFMYMIRVLLVMVLTSVR